MAYVIYGNPTNHRKNVCLTPCTSSKAKHIDTIVYHFVKNNPREQHMIDCVRLCVSEWPQFFDLLYVHNDLITVYCLSSTQLDSLSVYFNFLTPPQTYSLTCEIYIYNYDGSGQTVTKSNLWSITHGCNSINRNWNPL